MSRFRYKISSVYWDLTFCKGAITRVVRRASSD